MVTQRRIVVAGPYLDVGCTATVPATVALPNHQGPQDDDCGGECHGHAYNGHYGFNRHVGHWGESGNNGSCPVVVCRQWLRGIGVGNMAGGRSSIYIKN